MRIIQSIGRPLRCRRRQQQHRATLYTREMIIRPIEDKWRRAKHSRSGNRRTRTNTKHTCFCSCPTAVYPLRPNYTRVFIRSENWEQRWRWRQVKSVAAPSTLYYSEYKACTVHIILYRADVLLRHVVRYKTAVQDTFIENCDIDGCSQPCCTLYLLQSYIGCNDKLGWVIRAEQRTSDSVAGSAPGS